MIALLQARMSSRRLPGKVLKNINGKPMLLRVIENLKKAKQVKNIYIATSNHKNDKKIVNFCDKNNVNYFVGDLNDVSKRFKFFLEKNKNIFNEFIRISADSPLIDPNLIDKLVKIYKKKKPKILSNVFPRSFPKGQSVEIINTKFFLKNQKKFRTDSDKEHVTHFFYRKKKNILNVVNPNNYSHINMSVDTKKDLKIVRQIIKKIKKNKNPSWKDLINYFNEKKN